jgi:nucleoside-diphosphate-sugar epimerase
LNHYQPSTIAVTGATGFVGATLAAQLAARQFNVYQVPRASVEIAGAQCVIHCAARAHIMHDKASDRLMEYRQVNVQGTLNLARKAAATGAKRFVFLSSVKVNGERTDGLPPSSRGPDGASALQGLRWPRFVHGDGSAFTPNDVPAPEDAYGLSKWEAEQGLWEIASDTGMEVVVIRPPLVYGPGVKGNFARLLDLVRSGVPLPLTAVNNRRSFIGLYNLVDLLIRCVDHPKAAGQTLLVSDGQDLSTPELLRMIANAMGRPVRLFPLPVPLLRLAGRALGRLNEVDRIVGSLQIDSSATSELLGWVPPVSLEEGIRLMVSGIPKA